MPHSQNKRGKGGVGPTQRTRPAPAKPAGAPDPAPPHASPTRADGSGAGNGQSGANGYGIHGRRRSGRVTYQPKAAAMLTTHARTEDERLLDTGARPAFLDSDPWRSLRILAEFVEGFDALASIGKAVTIFGSARVDEGDPYYAKARQLAGLLAREGFAVITGGGPGVMEAANRGCHGGRRALDRLQHRAATRASGQPVRRPRRRVPLLLRPKDDVREVRGRLRHIPGRLRDAG